MRCIAMVPTALAVSVAACLWFGGTASRAAAAPAALGSVSGVVTGEDGKPVAGAVVELRGGAKLARGRSDSQGLVEIDDVIPGTYVLVVDAPGYLAFADTTLDVRAGTSTRFEAHLQRSASSLTTLGHVVTRAGEALSTGSAPSLSLDAQRFAAQGGADVADLIAQEAVSATVVRPNGGGAALPEVVAIRGPDPTETLVELDGHELNDGNSGSFDLSLLDPASLSDVQLVYGIAPSALIGPNTIGGAINVRTLDPTSSPEGLLRLEAGSYATFGETAETTGTDGAVGYALSLHRVTTRGEVDQTVPLDGGSAASVGSAVDGSTGLAKVRAAFDGGLGFAEVEVRDQSFFRDLSAGLTAFDPASSTFTDEAGTGELAHASGYGLDVSMPLGRGDRSSPPPSMLVFRHLTSADDRSVFGPGAGTSPYLDDERDGQDDDSVEWTRPVARGELSVKLDVRDETLAVRSIAGSSVDQSTVRLPLFSAVSMGDAPNGPPPVESLGQTQRSMVVRYAADASANLHYAAAAYLSDFSSFGTSFDPRFGATWTPTATTSMRASIGTTFQSPQLPELFVPSVLPPPDQNGYIDIGNPHLKADRATDLDLGLDHVFGVDGPLRGRFDLYRSDLRDASQAFIPAVNCLQSPPPPPVQCESYPVNVASAVYQGVEVGFDARINAWLGARASYSVNSAAPNAIASSFQNGSIVAGEQFEGVPLHSAYVGLAGTGSRVTFHAGARYEDAYDELHRPAFATVDAGIHWLVDGFDLGVDGTNLTDVYDDRFTVLGAGVPYGGVDGSIPTDAYALPGRALLVSLTRRL